MPAYWPVLTRVLMDGKDRHWTLMASLGVKVLDTLSNAGVNCSLLARAATGMERLPSTRGGHEEGESHGTKRKALKRWFFMTRLFPENAEVQVGI